MTRKDVAEVKEDVNQSTVEKLRWFSYTIDGKSATLSSVTLKDGMRPTIVIKLNGNQEIELTNATFGGFKTL